MPFKKGLIPWNKIGLIRKCLVCESDFYATPSDIKIGKAKYCSRSCYNKSKIGKTNTKLQLGEYKNCKNCGNKFYATRVQLKRGGGKFCSLKCYGKDKMGQPILQINYKNMVAWNKGLKFPQYSGINSPNWKGGKTPINTKIRNSSEFLKWSKIIKSRDNYECQICGQKGGKLRSNHIKTFIDYPNLRLEPTNGITICQNCDYRWVFRKEKQWESYFNFNLLTRGIIDG